MENIPFNKPFVVGKELFYISQAVLQGHLAGNGNYTKKCAKLLEDIYTDSKIMVTTSGTTALEMAAMLLDIKPGDEIILPSFTYVTTATAFYLRGAVLKFADISPKTLNINENLIESLINENTKAICPVHYAGVGCHMEKIMEIAKKYNIAVIEDAAHAFKATYKEQPLGTIGDFGVFSFHETKNIIAGEGGILAINNDLYKERADIIWEKGTNRKKFLAGIADKYTWVDIGSSFAPSELITAFLFAQLEERHRIIAKRVSLWDYYYKSLIDLSEKDYFKLPYYHKTCKHNGHIFYLLLKSESKRNDLLEFLNRNNIHAVFHYIPLHSSPMGKKMGYDQTDLPVTETISKTILRLPLYYELSIDQQKVIIQKIYEFFDETCPVL